MKLRLAIELEMRGRSPRQVREDFADALRQAIDVEFQAGRIDQAHAEELRRILPKPGHA